MSYDEHLEAVIDFFIDEFGIEKDVEPTTALEGLGLDTDAVGALENHLDNLGVFCEFPELVTKLTFDEIAIYLEEQN